MRPGRVPYHVNEDKDNRGAFLGFVVAEGTAVSLSKKKGSPM